MALTVTQIDTAIAEILTSGQSVTVDGVSYSKANLATLQTMRDRALSVNSKATRPTIRAMNFSGMGYS
jgi:hypothetical protein